MLDLIVPIGGLFLVVVLFGLKARNATHTGDVDRSFKLAALVIVGVLPALWLVGSVSYAERSMKKVDFCLQCHAMEKYAKSLHVDDDEALSADHFQNNRISREKACYACHSDYSAFGGIRGKLRGLRHVYAQYCKPIPEEIELYSPFPNDNCLRCHEGAKKYMRQKKHRLPEGRLDEIRSGKKSCITDCHDVGHYFDDEEEDE